MKSKQDCKALARFAVQRFICYVTESAGGMCRSANLKSPPNIGPDPTAAPKAYLPKIMMIIQYNVWKGGKGLNQSVNRIRELMNDSLQILSHMKVDDADAGTLELIRNKMKEQNRTLSEFGNSVVGAQLRQDVESAGQKLREITDMVDRFEGNMRKNYEQSTGANLQQFQQLSLEKQMQHIETYHDKIDYLSVGKLRENLSLIQAELDKQH
jgi:hypothetical protein